MTSIVRTVRTLSDNGSIAAFALIWAVMELVAAFATVNVEQVVWTR
jgi:hypothetical protein